VAVIDTVVGDLISNDNKGPQFRIVIGGFIVLVTLLALSDFQEDVADSLAIVILLATLFGPKGGSLSKVLSRITASGYKVPSTPIVQVKDPNAVWKVS